MVLNFKILKNHHSRSMWKVNINSKNLIKKFIIQNKISLMKKYTQKKNFLLFLIVKTMHR